MTSLIDKLTNLFNESNYEKLLEECQHLKVKTKIEKRILLHYSGMAWAAQGSFHKAQELLLKALKLGSNVQILRDLACCQYQLEEIDAWRNTYQKLQNLCFMNSRALSFSSFFSCEIVLAKFLEEEGRIGQALEIYGRLATIPEAVAPSRAYFQLAPQLLRLKAISQKDEELSQIYTHLLTSCDSNISQYWGQEIEHALILAEFELVGLQHAQQRLEQFLQIDDNTSTDKRLIFFDFLEECILKKIKVNKSLQQKMLIYSNDFSVYEKQIYELAFNKNISFGKNFHNLAKSMPLGCYLRLLCLGLASPIDLPTKLELEKKIKLILSGFSFVDQQFWIERISPYVQDETLILILDDRNKSIMFHARKTELSRKKLSFQLINMLSKKANWHIEEVIHGIWQSDYTPEHFNRLRMSVHRTNQLLFELTSKEKCIEMTAENLALNANISLKKTESELIH